MRDVAESKAPPVIGPRRTEPLKKTNTEISPPAAVARRRRSRHRAALWPRRAHAAGAEARRRGRGCHRVEVLGSPGARTTASGSATGSRRRKATRTSSWQVRSDKTSASPIGEVPAGGTAAPAARPRRPPAGAPPPCVSRRGSGRRSRRIRSRAAATRVKRQRRPIQSSVTVVNLASGEKKEYPKIGASPSPASRRAGLRFTVTAPTRRAAVRARRAGAAAGARAARGRCGGKRDGAGTAARHRFRSCATSPKGMDLDVGNVSDFSFRKDGTLLALAIDAQDKAGNGLQLRDMTTGVVTALDSGNASYERITWSDKGDALAVLKGTEDRASSRQVLRGRRRDGHHVRRAEESDLQSRHRRVGPKGLSDAAEPRSAVDGRSRSAALRPLRAAPQGRHGRDRRRARRRGGARGR